jgi:hypothetical protein
MEFRSTLVPEGAKMSSLCFPYYHCIYDWLTIKNPHWLKAFNIVLLHIQFNLLLTEIITRSYLLTHLPEIISVITLDLDHKVVHQSLPFTLVGTLQTPPAGNYPNGKSKFTDNVNRFRHPLTCWKFVLHKVMYICYNFFYFADWFCDIVDSEFMPHQGYR